MPIDAIASLAGPLAGALAPRAGEARGIPDTGLDGIQGLGNAVDDAGSVSTGPTFGRLLQNAIGDVNRAQVHAVDMSARFAAGEPVDVHQVMIAAQEASVALNMAIQVRNKLVDGYQELMRVSV